MATALLSWEDTGGARLCSITAVPSYPLALWINATPKVLGRARCWMQSPSSALSWIPASQCREERNKKV